MLPIGFWSSGLHWRPNRVIGGLRQLEEARAGNAKETARKIGAELARAGFGLVVYFSDDDSLEPYVVAGYSSHPSARVGSIRVRYAESQRGLVKFKEEAECQTLFDYRLFPEQDWEAPFYRSLAEDEGVNAVLLAAA
jgi:hypothetical protein